MPPGNLDRPISTSAFPWKTFLKYLGYSLGVHKLMRTVSFLSMVRSHCRGESRRMGWIKTWQELNNKLIFMTALCYTFSHIIPTTNPKPCSQKCSLAYSFATTKWMSRNLNPDKFLSVERNNHEHYFQIDGCWFEGLYLHV